MKNQPISGLVVCMMILSVCAHAQSPQCPSSVVAAAEPFDLAGAIRQAGSAQALLANTEQAPISSIGDFVAYVKNNSGRLSFGVTGMQSLSYEALRSLAVQLSVDITTVPYRTARDGLNDLVAGDLQAMFASPSSTLDFLRDGRILVVAKTR
jgi:tripartite-type tricarboxylate transporter receptor subunit TctC